MDESPNPAEAPTENRTGEIVGLASGFACILVLAFLGELKQVLPTGAAAVVFPVVFFSAVAGVVACALSLRENALYMSPRIGFRAGLIATLLGSGGIVLAATLAQFGLSTTVHGWGFYHSIGSLILPQALIGQACILAALSIPPSLAFGVTGAFLVGFLRLPALDANEAKKHPVKSMAWSAIFKGAVITSVVCYLSPFALVLRPKPKPVQVAVVPTPERQPTPEPPPSPPKWRYEKPAGFDDAPTARIAVNTIRSIGEIDRDQPVALAENGRLFAYAARGEKAGIVVHDLEGNETVASFALPFRVTRLAWSPDANRLFFISLDENARIGVLDVSKRARFLLPLPESEEIPQGRPFWFDTTEVLFFGPGGDDHRIDLENLTVTSADQSKKWKALSKEQQDAMRNQRADPFAEQRRWKYEPRVRVQQYETLSETSGEWRARLSPHLTLGEPKGSTRFFLPPLSLEEGDRMVGSPDGTRLIRIRRNQAETIYFGLRDEPMRQARLKVYSGPDESWKEALGKKELCVFICAPVKNPLNDRTVGPNREQVKAIGRILAWTDSEVQVWIEEAFEAVSVGDVAADLHRWEERSPITIRRKWWAAIAAVDASALASGAEFAVADRGPVLSFAPSGGSVAALPPREVPRTSSSKVSESKRNSAPANPAVEDEIAKFILNHHAKSSRNDIEGVVADYADRVDHFDKNVVDRDYIRKEETAYHAPGYRISERVVTPFSISIRSDGEFEANYTISYERVRPDGRWARGLADTTLRLAITPGGYRITYQRAAQRNQQKGP